MNDEEEKVLGFGAKKAMELPERGSEEKGGRGAETIEKGSAGKRVCGTCGLH